MHNSWSEPEKMSCEEGEQFRALVKRHTDRLLAVADGALSFHPDDCITGSRYWAEKTREVARMELDFIEQVAAIPDGFTYRVSLPLDVAAMMDCVDERLWEVRAMADEMEQDDILYDSEHGWL